MVALRGSHPGAGKSTLVNPPAGVPKHGKSLPVEFLIDGPGHQPDDVGTRCAHKFAIVSQETVSLFNGTVRENILYGKLRRHGRRNSKPWPARANCHEFISSFARPATDTRVGERGVKLSVGEKTARQHRPAHCSRTRPYSSSTRRPASVDTADRTVDSGSVWSGSMTGRTSFVICPSASAQSGKADQILVLRHGEIIEHGTHERNWLELGGPLRQNSPASRTHHDRSRESFEKAGGQTDWFVICRFSWTCLIPLRCVGAVHPLPDQFSADAARARVPRHVCDRRRHIVLPPR